MTPAQAIEKFFEGTGFLVRGKSYPAELPAVVEDYYCYTTDGGHSILCLIEGQFDYQARELWKSLCPVPVKHVLRGHRVHAGFPVVVAEYDPEVGLKD
jgi:hypothetical protein